MPGSRLRQWCVATAVATCAALAVAQPPATIAQKGKAKKANPVEAAQGKSLLNSATSPDKMKVAKGFKIELLYTVPKETEGSWVNLCTDPIGRLYTSDQNGGLFRITPPALGGAATETKVEKVPADIGEAQGMVWAFDSLYVVANSRKYQAGLYRITDKDGDGQLDTVKLLRKFEGGGGEHGPHAVMLHPDGKRLTVVCGNQTKLTERNSSKPAPIWGEDHLLPRMADGRGFMKGVMGPGGAIYNTDPEGKNWELFSVGFRNQFDAAYDRNGELFTYDADMEYDFNTPWYRPTRVCHVTSGSEFGWRNGAGKYPAYYADNLPSVIDIGPGSPTGVCFGYGAKFPAKYQDAFFICDWSYGKMYAVHMTPSGSSFKAVAEEFITGTPLPLTDLVINHKDGAMYFAIGGRKTQSGLYRVTYTGPEPTTPNAPNATVNIDRTFRASLDQFHGKKDPKAVEAAWPYLRTTDRFLRFSARVALESQPISEWKDKALAEQNPQASITALLGLTRASASCPDHTKDKKRNGDPKLGNQILESLNKIDFVKLTVDQRLELVRAYHVLFNRYGTVDMQSSDVATTLSKYDSVFPTHNRFVDGELAQLLVYLKSTTVAAKTIQLMTDAPTQEEQIEYARALRVLKTGWTPELRTTYFSWFPKAETYRGGMSFLLFVKNIKDDAMATLSDSEKVALKPILDMKPKAGPTANVSPRAFVKAYKMEDLVPKLEKGLAGGRDYDKGRKLFGATNCFGCHRFDNEGGAAGPDLTGLAGRFSPKDLLESIIDPSKEVSDQYQAVDIDTLDGKKISGRIVNLNGDGITLMTNMLDPSSTVAINRKNIDGEIRPSKLSMMPTGLLDTMTEDEVFDLLAYCLSRGDRNSAAFKK